MARGIGSAEAQKAAAGNELGLWVVIQPNSDVVVRVARSEMGQGTLTGLVQLVAEELEADWSKVKWEYVTPGQNLARKRAWGDFRTVGSWGIRRSHDYSSLFSYWSLRWTLFSLSEHNWKRYSKYG